MSIHHDEGPPVGEPPADLPPVEPWPEWVLDEDWPEFDDWPGPPAQDWAAPGVEPSTHPVAVVAERMHRELDEAHAIGVGYLDAGEVRTALVELHRVSARVAALTADLAAHASATGAGDVNGSPSAAVWLANETKLTRRDAHRTARIGDAVSASSTTGSTTGAGRYATALGPAFRDGRVGVEQADVIVRSLDDLPDTLDPDLVAQAEAWLVDAARDFDANDLRGLGKKILTVVAPEVGEAHDAAALEKEERDAAARARFTMSNDGEGSVRGRFTLPAAHGAMLRKALDAYASPGHKNAEADPEARFQVGTPSPQRLGEAFLELIENLNARDLPKVGGAGATVVVTMTIDSLMGGLAAASLDTGERISASEARRLACEAGIIPAVLGGNSVVLDMGRKLRFHTEAQRLALAIQHGGCITEGCNRPPHQCHAHHRHTWSKGGKTDLASAEFYCGHHHRKAHNPDYEIERLPTGKVRFHRRE